MNSIALTSSQANALVAFKDFLYSGTHCLLLKGCAGTGKTTLIAHIISYLVQNNRRFEVIAPTGRAARILGSKTRTLADTIHRKIYALKDVEVFELAQSPNDPGIRFVFPLKNDDPGETVFIVDESSMVGDQESKGDMLQFGSGRLLADLVTFARLGRLGRVNERGAKIVFVGDPAQLPPVGETLSPALSAVYLKETFGLDCVEFELTEVMRQETGSAVLDRATELRDSIGRKVFNTFDVSATNNDIVAASIPEAVSMIVEAYRSKLSSVFITYTNARALELNLAVRGQLWGDEKAELRVGDLLLVNKNSARTGLSNGDLVKVVNVANEFEHRSIRIKGEPQLIDLFFRQISIAYRGADGQIIRVDTRLLENLLSSNQRDLTPIEQRGLLVDFRQRNPHLKTKTAEFKLAIREDPYFNALQVKYGYAMTCHKAQGGEWETALVDFSNGRGKRNEEFFRWAYTAITRAKKKLVTINAPNINVGTDREWPPNPPSTNVPEHFDLPSDRDWKRFSFNPGQEPIFDYHLALRGAWEAENIQIERLDHQQYCERYLLNRGDEHAAVQYHYKSNLKVSKIGQVPGQVSNPDLLAVALATMDMVLHTCGDNLGSLNDPFLDAFKDKVIKAIEGSDISLKSVKPMQYRLRMEFEWHGQRTMIDFNYDKTPKWTCVQEVGGLGASHGLVDKLHTLIILMEDRTA